MKKILLGLLALIVLVVVFVVAYANLNYNKTFDYPLPEISALNDSATIERGKHLVFGPAHCALCHVPPEALASAEAGQEVALAGGWELNIPPGVFRAPNLTPDPETGIGNISDGQLARTLRHDVNHKGKFMLPVMPYQNLSDRDVQCIISYLRSRPAVKNKIQDSELTFLGKALVSFGMITPQQATAPPPKDLPPEPTAEYGKYMTYSLAGCQGCHTERNIKDGSFIGPDFAGRHIFEAEEFTQWKTFYSPNLTPDKETGVVANWSQDKFLERFAAGRIYEGSPMPWGFFSRMDSVELVATYKYLMSLEPIHNSVDKVVYEQGETLPEY